MSQTPKTSSDGGESRDWKSEAVVGHSQDSTPPPPDLVKRDIQLNDTRDPENVEQIEQLRLEGHENPLNWKNSRKCNVPPVQIMEIIAEADGLKGFSLSSSHR